MKIRNKIFNWFYGVKIIKRKGCRNAGIITRFRKKAIVKYDWEKPFQYQTKPYYFNYTVRKKIFI